MNGRFAPKIRWAQTRVLARRSGVPTPAIDTLFNSLDPAAPTLPEGQAHLKLDWRSTIAITGALVSMSILIGWLLSRKRK